MKITIAGNAILDVINEINSYPVQGMLEKIYNVIYSVGGPISNTGIFLKKLDSKLEVEGVGKVGSDQYGKFILDALELNGINTNKMIVDKNTISSYTLVMSERLQRTFFYYGAANDNLTYDDIISQNIDSDYFHLGYALLLKWFENNNEEYGNEFAHLFHDIQEKGIKTSLDVVSASGEKFKEVVNPSLKYLDYLIINETESSLLCDINVRNDDGSINVEAVKECAKFLKLQGIKDKVIIHCPELGVCYDGEFTICKSLKLPKGYIKGTTGAGDAYCAGALYGIMSGYSNKDILNLGASCAACNLSESNSIDGARSLEETIDVFKKYSQ